MQNNEPHPKTNSQPSPIKTGEAGKGNQARAVYRKPVLKRLGLLKAVAASGPSSCDPQY
jgi:hypothetical protein